MNTLIGKTLLLTRPTELAAPVVAQLRAYGGEPVLLPLLEIVPSPEPTALDVALADVSGVDWVIFISPSAVAQGVAAMQSRHLSWPPRTQWAAVGRATAERLRAVLGPGRPVWVGASGDDSTSLLALPALQVLVGKTVLLFRGVDGRAELAETLTRRGAVVRHAICYARRLLRPDPLLLDPVLARWAQFGFGPGGINAVSVTSREILEQLMVVLQPLAPAHWANTPLFVPHPRLATAAAQCGWRRVTTLAPGEDALLAALAALPDG